jgi:hypothetical protein
MADTVLRLLDGGFLRATSVGFRPIRQVRNTERGGTDYLQQELLEFSVVPVPANADALRRALKVMEADTREADDDVVFEPEDLAAAIADVLGDVVRVEIGRVLTVARGRIDDFDALADPAARHRHGEFDVDDGEVRALVAAALRDRAALGAVIGEATRSTLDRLRGRVD